MNNTSKKEKKELTQEQLWRREEILYRLSQVVMAICFLGIGLLIFAGPALASALTKVELDTQTYWDTTKYNASTIAQNKNFQIPKAPIKSQEAVNAALDLIPDAILDEYVNDDWHFVITNNIQKVTDKKSDKTVGVCAYKKQNIYLSTKLFSNEDPTYYTSRTVLHEVGHYVSEKIAKQNKELGKIAARDEDNFIMAYNDEVKSFYDNFYQQDRNDYTSEEFFADTFYAMIYNPAKLQQSCPGIYKIMFMELDNYINTLNTQK